MSKPAATRSADFAVEFALFAEHSSPASFSTDIGRCANCLLSLEPSENSIEDMSDMSSEVCPGPGWTGRAFQR